MSDFELLASGPAPIVRVITTNTVSHTSVFSNRLPESPHQTIFADGMILSLCYAASHVPVAFSSEQDITQNADFIANPPGLVIPGGFTARVVDFPPGYVSPMHRTANLSLNFVVVGEVELVLDSGETRQLKSGDMVVQRACNHAWRNMNESNWARITAVALPAVTEEISNNMDVTNSCLAGTI